MIENRRNFRIPFASRFIFSSEDSVLSGKSLNLSRGGIFVRLLKNPKVVSGSQCVCLFKLRENQNPVRIFGEVKRVVARSINPEQIPGIGFEFIKPSPQAQSLLNDFLSDYRSDLELISTILLAGEPDRLSLQPLVQKVDMKNYSDLGELKFHVESILQSIEIIQGAR